SGHGSSTGETRAMKRVHLVVLWHMHQPQYRDPESGRYVLPWTRLHALKDYWGMVDVLRGFPNFHATFNVVPSLGMQLEEYANRSFNEPWFSLAFKNAEELTREDKAEIIARAFQVNQERLMSRWPRFVELFEWSRSAGGARALVSFTTRDWRDLQLLSQLAWMEESWFQTDDVVSRLATKGKDYTETDKSALRKVQLAFRPMPSASTNPGACNWEEIALWVCFAITICPTLSASFTVAWTRKPPRRISTVECVISEKPYRAISPSRFVFSSMAKMPGNTTRGTVACSCASFTDASKPIRISAR